VALCRSCWERGADRIRVRGLVKWCLLFVEHVSAEVVGSLVVVELCLVGVAAVLGEAQLGLTLIDDRQRGQISFVGCGAFCIERQLCLVKAMLVAIGAGLFAFGDALIYIDERLLLV
jgi:hypothetical protein